MKKIIVTLTLLTVILTAIPTSSFAAMPMGFGGQVTVVHPCDTGELLYIRTPYAVLPFMWFSANLVFSWNVPPHPGQWLLGMYSTVQVPCFLGPVYIGQGFPIIYNGGGF